MSDMTVANEIARQVGGRAMKMMGGSTLVGGEDHLTWKVGRGAKANGKTVTHIKVTLTPEDLYDVEFFYCRGVNVSTIAKAEGIYADMLKATIEENTGFYLSL